ncbi:hypothetical protein [Nocardiopsis gilva]|nr:hypothetical protein [Nocardiopsis gilva]
MAGALVPCLWLLVTSDLLGGFGYLIILSFFNPKLWLIPCVILAVVWTVAWVILRAANVPSPSAVSGLATVALAVNALLSVIFIGIFSGIWIWPSLSMSLAGAAACASRSYSYDSNRKWGRAGVVVLSVTAVLILFVGIVVDVAQKDMQHQEELRRNAQLIRDEISDYGQEFAVLDGDNWHPTKLEGSAYTKDISIEYSDSQHESVEITSSVGNGNIRHDCDLYDCLQEGDLLIVSRDPDLAWSNSSSLKEARIQLDGQIIVSVSGMSLNKENVREVMGQVRVATVEDREGLVNSLAVSYSEDRQERK